MADMHERFTITESKSPLPILDVQLDGESISITSLVNLANQLANLLADQGQIFKVVKNATK